MGWLHATPKREGQKGPGVPRITTLTNKANLGGDVPDLETMPLEVGEHLVEYLFDVGPTAAGEVLTYSEIRAWVDVSGTVVTPWEGEVLRRMSAAYLAEKQDATDPERPSPLKAPGEPEARQAPPRSAPESDAPAPEPQSSSRSRSRRR